MGPAAVLSVLVKAEGIAKTNRKINTVDDSLQKAKRAAEDASGGMDKVAATTKALDSDLKKVSKSTSDAASAMGKASSSGRTLDGDLKKAGKSASSAAAAMHDAGVEADSYAVMLLRSHGMSTKQAEAAEDLRKRNEALSGSFGHLVGDTDDLASVLTRANAVHHEVAASTEKVEQTTRRASIAMRAWGNVTSVAGSAMRKLRGDSDGGRGAIGGLAAALGGAGRSLGGVSGGLSTFGAVAASLIPVLIALSGAIIAVGSALGPLVGLAAAGGVALSAAAQGFGVFKLATMGVADAVKASAQGAEQFEEALAKLPKPAADFARQVVALRPKLDELRATAAAGLFPGVSAGLSAAMNSFGAVKTVVGQTSTVMGGLAQKAGELVGSSAFGKDIETIGSRNATIIGTLGDAAIHVANALRHVMVAAGPLTSWLANTADGWAKNLEVSAKAGRESGRLAGFFEKTRAVLERLGSIFGHVASGLFGMGKAGTSFGNDILASIDKAAGRFDEWANSVGGQNELKRFFADTKKLADALVPAMGQLAGAVGTLVLRTLPLATALQLLGPAAGPLVTAFVAYKVAATVAAVASGVLTAAQWALNVALTANPIGLVIVGLAALAAGFVLAYTKVEWFREGVDAVFGWIKDHWRLIFGILVSPVGLAIIEIIRHWGEIKAATESVWNAISGFLSRVWGAIKTAAGDSWEAIKNVVLAPIRAARDLIRDTILPSLLTALGTAWGAIQTAADTGWKAIKTAIVSPVQSAFNFIKDDIVEPVVGWLAGKWQDITLGAKVFGLIFGNTMERAFAGIANVVIGFVNTIIGALNLIPGVDIGTVDSVKVPDKLSMGDAVKKAQGLYKGGKVSAPMAIVGEEGRTHPEYVIPTNPAYRGRALGLLGAVSKDLGVPGFFKGGVLTSSYGPPWTGINGTGVTASGVDLRPAKQMLGVAVDPSVIALGSKLKINPNPFETDQPFTAFDTGSAIKGNRIDFYDWRGRQAQMGWGMRNAVAQTVGGGGGILGALKDVAGFGADLGGKIAGAATGFDPMELFERVKRAMPSAGGLPGWLQGMGGKMVGNALSWAKDQIFSLGGLFGGGGGGGGGTATGTLAIGQKIARMFGLSISSTYRTPEHNRAVGGVEGSLHTHGSLSNPGAIDEIGSVDQMYAALNWARANVALKEAMVHDAGSGLHLHLGFFRKGGIMGSAAGKLQGFYKGGTIGAPYAGSFDGGGVVPGPLGAPRLATVHGGEVIHDPRVGGGAAVEFNHYGDVIYNTEADMERERRKQAFQLQNALRGR